MDDVEPIGNNNWCLLATKFNKYGTEKHLPHRVAESLKAKFDRLANTKKPTGDPSCPPSVRRAKHIARYILNKFTAISVGDESSDDDRKEDNDAKDGIEDLRTASSGDGDGGKPDRHIRKKRENPTRVGDRKRQRKAGAAGVKTTPEGDEML